MRYFIFFLFFAISAHAEKAEIIAQKISLILSQKCDLAPQSKKGIIHIAYLRGSPIDAINAPEAGEKLLQIVSEVGQQLGYEIKTQALHHTSWRSVCDEFKNTKNEKLYLVGHSYGASGSVKIAHCLKKESKTIDYFASISSYDLFAGVDVEKIPDNIFIHTNFWTNDSSMPGYKEHVADDPTKTRVQNILAEHKSSFPHLKVAEDIVSLIALQILANLEGNLDYVVIPDKIDGNKTDENLDTFWSCPNYP